ncbi:E3 UBIQUITIN-PROTEIN LIGASE RNF5-RELATED [Salix viminalis]|uniref:E3 ubiquitin-protein ligase RMA n=1 Tax=Salix viminalis TaxID=40686 RepID=A0A9Q0SGA0_SALVM|nr:E3 UBIQUITIN-PROTEIN LIGASE RNF5-RELATED [Salix viminalis]
MGSGFGESTSGVPQNPSFTSSNGNGDAVCKALVEEEKLVPLYGRGKTSTDPRSKSIPGVNIPNRPAGQRPETAPPPEPNHFGQHGFGFTGGLGGFGPPATASTKVKDSRIII